MPIVSFQNSLDASNIKGVKIEPMSGSRIEYDPLPRGNILFPGLVGLFAEKTFFQKALICHLPIINYIVNGSSN